MASSCAPVGLMLVLLCAPPPVLGEGWFGNLMGAVGLDKKAEVEVTGHSWERAIPTSKLVKRSSRAWCGDLGAPPLHLNESLGEREDLRKRSREEAGQPYDVRRVGAKSRSHSRRVELRTGRDGNYTYQECLDWYGVEAGERREAPDGRAYTRDEFAQYFSEEEVEDRWRWAKPAENPRLQKAEEYWNSLEPIRCSEGECCSSGGVEGASLLGHKCREEGVDAYMCEFSQNSWEADRTYAASGSDRYPYWPDAPTDNGTTVGCVKQGTRSEKYTLWLIEKAEDGSTAKTHCTASDGSWDLATWQSFKVNSNYSAKRRKGYGILCTSVEKPRRELEERRTANDGKPYTYADFVEFYGAYGIASERWEAAPVAHREEM